jgi:peptide/nickel transport system ATP-binding protein
MAKATTILEVKDLEVSFDYPEFNTPTLKRISFSIHQNEILAIVGESGSGKSVTSLAIMGLLPNKLSKITRGDLYFLNQPLLKATPQQMMAMRGKDISMIFQEPMSALNPSMRCGKQVEEVLLRHGMAAKQDVRNRVLELFDQVQLPKPARIYKSYPHEISGGQKQRVMIAMAIACEPKLLIADEPTTALDVTVQKEIIDLLKDLQKKTKMSILFISHDLALVSEIADRVLVMYKGQIVEQGATKTIFRAPKQAYTKALIQARPESSERAKRLPTVSSILNATFKKQIVNASERTAFHKALYSQIPILEVNNVSKYYLSRIGWFQSETFKAVDDVSFKVYPGETLGLVGESGCGKSTLSNTITLLTKASKGQIYFRGKDITRLNTKETRQLRKSIQIIFQDPFASLNPRLSVEKVLMEPMKVHGIGNTHLDRKTRIVDILNSVGLQESDLKKYPHEFSGGQRQRIGIARAIILEPELIICDESVSALDISVQAQVLNLLNDLKDRYQFTYIFISHDLNVVKYMADQLLVMKDGKIEEHGEADHLYANPQKAYTKQLIESIPKGL